MLEYFRGVYFVQFPPARGEKYPRWVFFGVKIWEVGGGERRAAARLGCSLCQGYKQAVIRLPNRIILPVSAPKHMGPHKAAAAPDRHPFLITQRRGAGPFLYRSLSLFCFSFAPVAVEEMHLFSFIHRNGAEEIGGIDYLNLDPIVKSFFLNHLLI